MTGATFDAGRLGRMYDAPAVVEQRSSTRRLLDARKGDRVLDLGCGPGHLTAELVQDVGAAGQVLGVDRQRDMVVAARARATTAGAGRCDVLMGSATALPLADGACDRVVAVQVLEYVPDLEQAVAELRRVLRPGGTAVLVDTDWRSCVWHTTDRGRTDAVLRAWEAHFVHPHLPAAVPELLRRDGMTSVRVRPVPVVETDPDVADYSLGMADLIATFVSRTEPELAERWREDVLGRAAAGDYFFSVTRFAAVATR